MPTSVGLVRLLCLTWPGKSVPCGFVHCNFFAISLRFRVGRPPCESCFRRLAAVLASTRVVQSRGAVAAGVPNAELESRLPGHTTVLDVSVPNHIQPSRLVATEPLERCSHTGSRAGLNSPKGVWRNAFCREISFGTVLSGTVSQLQILQPSNWHLRR